MRPFRSLGSVALIALLAHLNWAGIGLSCGMPGTDHGAAGMLDAGMPGMPGMEQTADNSRAPANETPCDSPLSHGCQSMAPCSAISMAAHSTVSLPESGAPAALPRMVALTPPSLVRAPELPPPRA